MREGYFLIDLCNNCKRLLPLFASSSYIPPTISGLPAPITTDTSQGVREIVIATDTIAILRPPSCCLVRALGPRECIVSLLLNAAYMHSVKHQLLLFARKEPATSCLKKFTASPTAAIIWNINPDNQYLLNPQPPTASSRWVRWSNRLSEGLRWLWRPHQRPATNCHSSSFRWGGSGAGVERMYNRDGSTILSIITLGYHMWPLNTSS